MDFTTEMSEILFRACALGCERGQVLEPWALPDAHRVAEAGWLERRFEENGDISWWWTPQAETALHLTALTTAQEGREN